MHSTSPPGNRPRLFPVSGTQLSNCGVDGMLWTLFHTTLCSLIIENALRACNQPSYVAQAVCMRGEDKGGEDSVLGEATPLFYPGTGRRPPAKEASRPSTPPDSGAVQGRRFQACELLVGDSFAWSRSSWSPQYHTLSAPQLQWPDTTHHTQQQQPVWQLCWWLSW